MCDLQFTEWAFDGLMKKYFRRAKHLGVPTTTNSPEEFYGFRPTDVAAVHFHKQGFGEGFWFRLKDGRVFAWYGLPSVPDAIYYDTTAH